MLWRAHDGSFELYQKIQKRPVYARAAVLASFVVTPFDETLFVGLYLIKDLGQAEAGLTDPISGKDVSNHYFYDLSPLDKLIDYQGRLTIDWGEGFRSWTQWAYQQDKPVLEIRRVATEPPFPGYLKLRVRLSELAHVPMSWRTALSSVSGVYLLIHPESGKQYVGIAKGTDGFWGRWEQYVATGHGGNRRMQDIPAADYQVTILEVASLPVTDDALAEMEARWKLKLLSREFGLNAN